MRLLVFFLSICLTANAFAQKITDGSAVCAAQKRLAAAPPPLADDFRSDSLDLLQTIIELDLSDMANQRITANCRQIFTPKVAGVPEIRLDLEALTVDSVHLDGQKTAFTHQNKVVRVVFPAAMNPSDTAEVRVFYRGKPVTTSWGGFYFQSGYAYNLGVGIATDPPNFGRAWFPCFDNFEERSRYIFHTLAPAARSAFCNGTMTAEETLPDGRERRTWQLDEPIPSYLACVAAGPYTTWRRVFPGETGQIPVEIAVAAGDSTKLRQSFVHLEEAIAAFEDWFGPYRWPKVGYSVVPFSSGAMEHATNIAYMRPAVDGTTASETLMAHELSHHWWGDLATCSSAGDMWLNEGWASFCEHLFLEKTYGRAEYLAAVDGNHLSVLQSAHINEGGYRAVSGIPAAYTYGSHVYNKGAVVAHNLRGYLGDALFRTGCRAVLAQTEFDDWSSAEFRDRLTDATGVDLTDFFDDWVFAPGYSVFVVDSFQANGPLARVFVKQKLRGAPHFHQNVPLEFTFLDANRNRTTRMAMVSGENSTLNFDLPFEAKWVFVNVGHLLNLARADRERVIKTTGNQPFAPAKMDLKVNTLPDSAFVRVEYYFARPDTAGAANPKNYRLTNRFWSVRGEFEPGFDAQATFQYDGRGQLDLLDAELFRQTSPNEDSILLLYRPGAGAAWREFPTYTKFVAAPNDRFGLLRADHLLPGDYTIGKGVSEIIGTSEPAAQILASVSPNPASDFVRVATDRDFSKLLIFNALGDAVREFSFEDCREKQIPVGDLPAGMYWFWLHGKRGAGAVSFQKM